MKDAIIASINALQHMLDVAAELGEISDEEYEIAFHAASAIESFVNPEEWVDYDPLGDLANAVDRLREGR